MFRSLIFTPADVAFESDDEFVEPGLAISANIVDDGSVAAGERRRLAVLVLEGFIHSVHSPLSVISIVSGSGRRPRHSDTYPATPLQIVPLYFGEDGSGRPDTRPVLRAGARPLPLHRPKLQMLLLYGLQLEL